MDYSDLHILLSNVDIPFANNAFLPIYVDSKDDTLMWNARNVMLLWNQFTIALSFGMFLSKVLLIY